MLEKQLKFIEYTRTIHSLVRLNVFERVQNAHFKFLDDIKNSRLKGLKPKNGTFVKREDIPAGNSVILFRITLILNHQSISGMMGFCQMAIPGSKEKKTIIVSPTSNTIMVGN